MDDLATEFMEDLLENDEDLAREMRLKYLGYEIAPTGDPLIDLWEKQIAEGQVPDLDYMEPENAKARDKRIREAAREHYAKHGYSSVYKAPTPDMPLSLEEIDRKRQGIKPDMSRYGLKDEGDLVFDDNGYPVGTASMTPETFDRIGNLDTEGFRKLDADTLRQFAEIGEAWGKKG